MDFGAGWGLALAVSGSLLAFDYFVARSPRSPIGRFLHSKVPPWITIVPYGLTLFLMGQVAQNQWGTAGGRGYFLGFMIGGAALAWEMGIWGRHSRSGK